MKGLFTAFDPGRELWRPSLHAEAKQVVPIANRPFATYVVETLREAGISEIAVVVSRATAGPVGAALGSGDELGVSLTYIDVERPAGILDAARLAEAFAGDDALLVHPGDVVFGRAFGEVAAQYSRNRPDCLLVVAPGHRGPWSAKETPAHTSLSGACVLGPRAFHLVREVVRADRGARVSELARHAHAAGVAVETCVVDDWSRLAPSQSSLIACTRVALEAIVARHPDGGSWGAGALREGNVLIDASAYVEASTLRGPALVGPEASVRHSFIGPFTSIGARATIEGAELENSIVLAHATVRHVPKRIHTSVIGERAKVTTDFSLPRGLRLATGDDAEVTMS